MKIYINLPVHLLLSWCIFVNLFIGAPSHDSSKASKFKGSTLYPSYKYRNSPFFVLNIILHILSYKTKTREEKEMKGQKSNRGAQTRHSHGIRQQN